MKKTATALIVVSILVLVYFGLREGPEPEAPPRAAQAVTIRGTTAGEVVGFIGDHGARTWLGIPFAQPPVGALRWRAPQPPEPWEGTRETIVPGSMCPQKPSPLAAPSGPDAGAVGSEDCLYLNVWAPANAARLPVMVWIHGGGNTIGRGDDYIGARLATRHNLVVVTINYRLGPFGWFAHPALTTGSPQDDSGNFGTLDIIQALAWTRENIREFGGDPDNVTVFGESAGAFDTLAMMASPLAKGLFHKAISQSGGFSPTPRLHAQQDEAEGGHPYSAREIVNRLLVVDGRAPDRQAAAALQTGMGAPELREYLYGKTPDEIFALWGDSGFGMISAPDNFGDGYVLPALSTAEIFSKAANHQVVPVILGTNRDEPALFMAQDPAFTKRFLWLFPRLKDEDSYLRIVRYGALAWKARGVDELADYMEAAGNPQVYAYRFDWDELPTRGGYDLGKALGAAHFLEVPFVFGDFENFPLSYLFEESPSRDALSESMMSYWAQFAYTGDPGRGRDGDLPHWLSWGTDGQRSLILDTPSGGGIRMMDERVTRQSVVEAIASDPAITSQRERCEIYLRTFRWGGQFDRAEYDGLGDEGCAAFDPAALQGG